jgi:hypothetical protein
MLKAWHVQGFAYDYGRHFYPELAEVGKGSQTLSMGR